MKHFVLMLSAAAVALVLSSCTYTWHKDGATDQEGYRDVADCAAIAGQAGYTGLRAAGSPVMDYCMRGKGWTP